MAPIRSCDSESGRGWLRMVDTTILPSMHLIGPIICEIYTYKIVFCAIIASAGPSP